MRALLLSSLPRRLAMSAAVSFLLFVGFSGLVGFLTQEDLGNADVRIVLAVLVALTALVLALTVAGRRLILADQTGWLRLLLVLSASAATADIVYRLFARDDLLEALVEGVMVLFTAMLVGGYGRLAFLWVTAGFRENEV